MACQVLHGSDHRMTIIHEWARVCLSVIRTALGVCIPMTAERHLLWLNPCNLRDGLARKQVPATITSSSISNVTGRFNALLLLVIGLLLHELNQMLMAFLRYLRWYHQSLGHCLLVRRALCVARMRFQVHLMFLGVGVCSCFLNLIRTIDNIQNTSPLRLIGRGLFVDGGGRSLALRLVL